MKSVIIGILKTGLVGLFFCAALIAAPEGSSKAAATNADSNAPSQQQTAAQSQTQKVAVNTAGSEELQRLPRVGPAIAQRIIDYRAQNGPFKAWDDLLKVKGIGPKTLEHLKPMISLD